MCEMRTETRYFNRSECLACGHQDKVYHPSKEEYKEVTVCPKCNGAFVDMFKLGKYKQSDIDAVPIVLYKGEEIKGRVRVSFDWKTNYNRKSGSYIHVEPDEQGINTKIIQHNHPIVEEQVEFFRL
ncbi:hypothetical protein [Bacillus sp. CDB3]|uniref:hypothetical protein n=1 Tax=Bacillus sp. CDB3 TaxID=360310 RepID=UPI0009D8F3BB|nr:hypothetical protein [Bacillus sp. CDB3]OQR56196.1 hypothetical protein CDB3_13785 [Bacillus sp. CDB3]